MRARLDAVDLFVARQPIFTAKQKVFAYEILFRAGEKNAFDHKDGTEATSRVVIGSFMTIGVDKLTEGKKAFINFTRELIVGGNVDLLPKDKLVVEVLETIDPEPAVIAGLTALKNAGYVIALDDFVYEERFEPMLALADFVKVDFMKSDGKERRELATRCQKRGIRPLAEKVETQQDFEEAKSLGYHYFQGYFFSKPVVIKGKDMRGSKLAQLRILDELHRGAIDYARLEVLMKSDVSMSFRLLKYVNSAALLARRKIDSIRQGLVMLGDRGLKKWVSFIVLAGMGDDKPSELMRISAVRARFLELMAPLARMEKRAQDLFMLGMFSVIDALMDRPMAEVLAEIGIDPQIKDALLGKENALSDALSCVTAYERGEWFEVSRLSTKLGLADTSLPDAYLEAVEWVASLLE